MRTCCSSGRRPTCPGGGTWLKYDEAEIHPRRRSAAHRRHPVDGRPPAAGEIRILAYYGPRNHGPAAAAVGRGSYDFDHIEAARDRHTLVVTIVPEHRRRVARRRGPPRIERPHDPTAAADADRERRLLRSVHVDAHAAVDA